MKREPALLLSLRRRRAIEKAAIRRHEGSQQRHTPWEQLKPSQREAGAAIVTPVIEAFEDEMARTKPDQGAGQ